MRKQLGFLALSCFLIQNSLASDHEGVRLLSQQPWPADDGILSVKKAPKVIQKRLMADQQMPKFKLQGSVEARSHIEDLADEAKAGDIIESLASYSYLINNTSDSPKTYDISIQYCIWPQGIKPDCVYERKRFELAAGASLNRSESNILKFTIEKNTGSLSMLSRITISNPDDAACIFKTWDIKNITVNS